jgi:peptidyl-tRNA hydrolase, PTH1 family
MKLVVGLGNPGRFYANSRHNVGFMVIKELADGFDAALKKDGNALSVKVKVDGQDLILAQPHTFMNLSGSCVKALSRKYRAEPQDILVVCDDLDLDFGRTKLRPSGSSGGQNGLASVIDALGTREFPRLRIGIGRPLPEHASQYVLASFSKQERQELKEIITRAAECCLVWVREGVVKSMDAYNRRSS